MNKETWNRLAQERTNLQDKIKKLENFLETTTAQELDNENLLLLEIQLHTMKKYRSILTKRIRINRPQD